VKFRKKKHLFWSKTSPVATATENISLPQLWTPLFLPLSLRQASDSITYVAHGWRTLSETCGFMGHGTKWGKPPLTDFDWISRNSWFSCGLPHIESVSCALVISESHATNPNIFSQIQIWGSMYSIYLQLQWSFISKFCLSLRNIICRSCIDKIIFILNYLSLSNLSFLLFFRAVNWILAKLVSP
jgi:hypothetical protein